MLKWERLDHLSGTALDQERAQLVPALTLYHSLNALVLLGIRGLDQPPQLKRLSSSKEQAQLNSVLRAHLTLFSLHL